MANTNITNRRGNVVATVSDNQINQPSPVGTTSINVVGRNVLDYGDEIGNNFHWLMENFAGTTAPDGPVAGQLWWDMSDSLNPKLRVYSEIVNNWISVTKIGDDENPFIYPGVNLNANSNKIVNMANPTNNQDAATKVYVDSEIANALGSAADTFVALTDTPSSFLGQANKVLKVSPAQDSIIFSTLNFLNLGDTPSLYAGAANRVVRVNASANALEFKQLTLSDISVTGPLNMLGFRIEGLGSPNSSDDVINLGYADDRYLRDTQGNSNGIVIRTSSTGETLARSVASGSGIIVSNGNGVSGNPTVSHADTSSQGSVNNSGNTVIQDIILDQFGHITGITSKTITTDTGGTDGVPIPSGNGIVVYNGSSSSTRTITGGSGINVSNGNGVSGNPSISHADTSSQNSVNNSGNTVIQDITLDAFGHITGINSTTISGGSSGLSSVYTSFSKAGHGYVVLDGGSGSDVIIQWGQRSINGTTGSITWPISFPTGVLQGVICLAAYDDNSDDASVGFTSLSTTTGFWRSGGTVSSARYIVIGY